MDLKSENLKHFPPAAAPAAEFNKCVDAEKPAGSRVLLRFFALRATKCFQQHPRHLAIFAHDRR
jgi:hypothetical protein